MQAAHEAQPQIVLAQIMTLLVPNPVLAQHVCVVASPDRGIVSRPHSRQGKLKVLPHPMPDCCMVQDGDAVMPLLMPLLKYIAECAFWNLPLSTMNKLLLSEQGIALDPGDTLGKALVLAVSKALGISNSKAAGIVETRLSECKEGSAEAALSVGNSTQGFPVSLAS